jgi:hypothetical protein
LGGFSPHSFTAAAFINDCGLFRSQKRDEIYLLDFNRQPFEKTSLSFPPEGKKLFRVQADLAKMPFANESLDLIWLDGTTSFMDNEKLSCFGKEAGRTLTEEGVVVSIFPEPLVSFLPSFRSARESRRNHTQVYSRSVQENLSLLKDLKLIWHLMGDWETALVFAPKDSPYTPFSGRPFALEAVNDRY